MVKRDLVEIGKRSGAGLPAAGKGRTLLLGLGNDLLTDDAVGLHIASALANDEALRAAGVDVIQTTEMGLSLLDIVTGYDELIIVDSIQTRRTEPGAICEIEGAELSMSSTVSPHFLGIGEMLALGRELGLQVPSSVKILAIEAADPFTVGTALTPPLEKALPGLTRMVREYTLRIKSPDLKACG